MYAIRSYYANFEQEWALFKDWNRRYPSATGEKIAFCAGDSFPNLARGEFQED